MRNSPNIRIFLQYWSFVFPMMIIALSSCNSEPISLPTSQPIATPSISELHISEEMPVIPGKEIGIAVEVSAPEAKSVNYQWSIDERGGEIVTGEGSSAIIFRAPLLPGTYKVAVVITIVFDNAKLLYEKSTFVEVQSESTGVEPTNINTSPIPSPQTSVAVVSTPPIIVDTPVLTRPTDTFIPPTFTSPPIIPSDTLAPPPTNTFIPPTSPLPTPTPFCSPLIEFTYVPTKNSFDDLRGRISCAIPANYKVAVYIYVSGWWNKPTWNEPLTPISADGIFVTDITTDSNTPPTDPTATKIAAFLVPNGYIPPQMAGEQSLPTELFDNSVAQVTVDR